MPTAYIESIEPEGFFEGHTEDGTMCSSTASPVNASVGSADSGGGGGGGGFSTDLRYSHSIPTLLAMAPQPLENRSRSAEAIAHLP